MIGPQTSIYSQYLLGARMAGLGAGLTSYWTLNETSGSRLDSVGTDHLTDNNTVGFVAGVNGNAASFVGANSESLSGTFIPLDASLGFTIAGWLSVTTGSSAGGVYARNGDAIGTGGGFELSPEGIANTYLLFVANNDALESTTANLTPLGNLSLDVFHHFVCWYDPTDKKVRGVLDGGSVEVAPGALTSDPVFDSSTFNLGGVSPASFSTSGMDEVGVWNRVLTAQERATLYNAGVGTFYPF